MQKLLFSVKCVQPQNSASTRCQCFFYQPLNVFEHLWVLDGWSDLCGKTQSAFEAATEAVHLRLVFSSSEIVCFICNLLR